MPDVAELGRKFKAKHPKAYDDLDDAALGRKVKVKYPGAYDDFEDGPAMPPGAAEFAKPPAVPKLSMTEARTPSGFLSNVARGVLDIPKGLYAAATNPSKILDVMSTAGSAGEIPSAEGPDYTTSTPPSLESHPLSQVASYASTRYGSPSKIAETLYQDPVGAGMDVASIVAPAAVSTRLATAAPKLAKASRVAVAVLDPITEVAIPASAGLAAKSAARLGKTANLTSEGRWLNPRQIYGRALQPTSALPDGPKRLAELEKKTTTGFGGRYTPGSEGSLSRAVAEQTEWGRQKRGLEQTNPDAPVWLGDIQNYASRKASEDYAGRSGFWKLGDEGPEIGPVQASIRQEIEALGAEPKIRQGMRSYGPLPREVSLDIAATPARLGDPVFSSASTPFTIPPSRQLEQPAIPLPPPSGPTQIAFDPKQVYEPTTTQPPGKEWVEMPEQAREVFSRPRRVTDSTIQTERVPQMEADIPPVPGRHLEGQQIPTTGRPEPVQPAPRDLVESTRDEQVRGVLASQGFTNEGYRQPSTPPPVPSSPERLQQSLASRGVVIERPIISEVPQGSVKLPTAESSAIRPRLGKPAERPPTLPGSDATRSLRDIEQAIADPNFPNLPSEQQNQIKSQLVDLQRQLATPGTEPYLPATAAEIIKEGRGKDVGDSFGLPSADVTASTTTAKYVHHGIKEALEAIWPGIDKINANYGELAALIPDLARSVEGVKFGRKESAPAAAAFAVGAGAAAGPTAAIPALTAAGMRALLHSPDKWAKFAFWLDDQMKKPPGRVARSTQELQAAFDAAPKSEIARIAAQMNEYLGIAPQVPGAQ